jgi:hypothetical protein
MAIDLSALFGQQPDYSQLISPAETQRMQSNASQQALLNAAIAMLGASGTQPRPISTGQALGGALAAGMGGYNEAFDRTLKQMVTGMQLEEYKRKKQSQEMARQAVTQTPQPIPMATGQGSQLEMLSRPEFGGDMAAAETVGALRANLPTKTSVDLNKLIQAIAVTDPIEAAKLMSKEPKESFRPLSAEEKKAFGLPQDQSFQISSSGKIDQVSKGELVKNIIGGEVSPFEKKSQEKLAENYVTITDSGRTARRSLSDINRLESLLEKTNTGFGASAKLAAGNIGIVTKGLSELQAAEALINKLVPQQRPPGSGTMSDADLELYKKSVVRIINQPGANKLIIESTKDINNYIVKEADIANQVLNGKISREEADRKFAELGNPVQDFFKKNPSIIGGSPSTKGVRFLNFEPTPTGQ